MIIGKIQKVIPFVSGWFAASVVLILASGGMTLSARAGADVVAWGAGKTVNIGSTNDYGQSIVPANLTNAVLVAGGWRHSLALKSDGTLQAWGDDSAGQTGFSGGTNFLAIACGELFSLALGSNSTVAAAGGEDGYGETAVPVDLTNVVAVACGYYHGLALKSDGTVAAWGAGMVYNPKDPSGVDFGQSIIPAGLSNVVAIAGGGYHSLALKSDGTVVAWGAGTINNPGDGYDYGQSIIPPGLSNVVAIAAGNFHNLALKSDGTITGWGLNNYGQTNVPAGLSHVVAIAARELHNLALTSQGKVVAWGLNTEGDTNVPSNLTNVIQIATGDVHCLALVGSVPPAAQVLVTNIVRGTNGFSLSLPTQNGRVYQLQYQNSLTGGAWQSLPLQAGTGEQTIFTDTNVVQARFYRVLRW